MKQSEFHFDFVKEITIKIEIIFTIWKVCRFGSRNKNILRKKIFSHFLRRHDTKFLRAFKNKKNNVFVFFDRCRAETKVGYPVYQWKHCMTLNDLLIKLKYGPELLRNCFRPTTTTRTKNNCKRHRDV